MYMTGDHHWQDAYGNWAKLSLLPGSITKDSKSHFLNTAITLVGPSAVQLASVCEIRVRHCQFISELS